MNPLTTYLYPNIPAATPEDGDPADWSIVGAHDAAIAHGDTYWDPQPDDPTTPTSTQPGPTGWEGLLRTLGIGRPSRHPAPTPMQTRETPGLYANTDGSHAEFVNEIQVSPQGMEGQGVRGNTFRAAPTPWDSRMVYGAQG